MINSVVITNHLGEVLTLEPRFPEKSGFLIRNIDGLDPVKVDINLDHLYENLDSVYEDLKVGHRNIVFSFGYLPSPSIESTRLKCYKYFPLGRRILIQIITDNRYCETYGKVESNELNVFTKKPGAIVSVICNDQYLYSSVKTTTLMSLVDPLFEFPFSNESLTTKLIEFGNIFPNEEQAVLYNGDASVGVVMYLHALGPVTNLRIINVDTNGSMKILSNKLIALTNHDIMEGDDIIISTIKGLKYVKLLRDGVYTNIINCLDKDPTWFRLNNGYNRFVFLGDPGSSNVLITIQNQTAFNGV